MRKFLLLSALVLISFYTKAQKKDYDAKLKNCGAVEILETVGGITQVIDDEGKLIFRKEFIEPRRKKDFIYTVLKRQLRILHHIKDEDDEENEDNTNQLNYKEEGFLALDIPSKNKEIYLACKIKIAIKDHFYTVEISDIFYAKVKNRNNKRIILKNKTFESILNKEKPDCKIVKYLDEYIAWLFEDHKIRYNL